MYKKFVLLALAVPFFLTGCWDKKDPEDRAFIITLGVDAAENGCHFTFAPANIETGEAEIYAAELTQTKRAKSALQSSANY